MAAADGTSEAVFALVDQYQDCLILTTGANTYSAVQMKVDVVICGPDIEVVFALIDQYEDRLF